MLRNLFCNRLFIAVLAFLVCCVVGSLLYLHHVERQVAKEFTEKQKRIEQGKERQNQQPIAEASIVEPPKQDGHVQANGMFPVAQNESSVDSMQFSEPNPPVSEDATTTPSQKQHTKGSGNPLMFKNVPVDLSDFEATKAFMLKNVDFVKTNWDPKVFNFQVSKARDHIYNISSYANSMLCYYTPKQRNEIRTLRLSLLLCVFN